MTTPTLLPPMDWPAAAALRGPDAARAAEAAPAALGLADAFAVQLWRWARAAGATEADAQRAARAGHALSLAVSEGHVCLELAQLPGDAAAWRSALLASGTVGTPRARAARPLLLDDEGRLYLHRDYALEEGLARQVARRATAPPLIEAPHIPEALRPADAGTGVDWPLVAAALALRQRLTVVSGGPGTGKTTAVVRLLALLLAHDPDCRIALAAPTGKAAARMSEALRLRAGSLPPALRERLPTEAATLHRLLKLRPPGRGSGPRATWHAGHPLPLDVLVVDEASMLDLSLAARLFDALPPDARLVLLGDQDQLASVESGAVFAELGADPGLGDATRTVLAAACGLPVSALQPPAPRAPTGLRDSVVWFDRNHRFAADSAIGRLARQVRDGDAAGAVRSLQESAGAPDRVELLPDGGQAPGAAALRLLQDGVAGYLQALRALLDGLAPDEAPTPEAVAALLRAFDAHRTLCALRVGPRGASALDRMLERHARQQLGPRAAADAGSPWYAGRPVMVLRNDPLLRLFNGDIGLALPARRAGAAAAAPAARFEVWFPDARRGVRAVAPVRLPEHAGAWALTVHQSQGSEFDAVTVVLPAEPHRVMSRELLYTAVTRARHRVSLVGTPAVVEAAVRAPTRRHSGLVARLRECLAEPQRADPPEPQEATG